jgi:hypothetical protein
MILGKQTKWPNMSLCLLQEMLLRLTGKMKTINSLKTADTLTFIKSFNALGSIWRSQK